MATIVFGLIESEILSKAFFIPSYENLIWFNSILSTPNTSSPDNESISNLLVSNKISFTLQKHTSPWCKFEFILEMSFIDNPKRDTYEKNTTKDVNYKILSIPVKMFKKYILL